MARVNINILGISKLKWMGVGEFNSDDHYICYCGQESLRRNGVALIVNKRVQDAVFACSLKNDRMILACFQGKPFNISNPNQCPNHWYWISWRQPVLQRPATLPRTNTKKWCPFHHKGLEYKSRESRDTQNNRQVWPWSTIWSMAKAKRVLPREHTGHSKHPFPKTQEMTLHMDITR